MKIDFLTNRIIVTKAELKRASMHGSREFHELLDIHNELPDFQIEMQHSRPCPQVSPSPTYASMENYLSSLEDTTQLDAFYFLRRSGRNYAEIKKWFMNEYPGAFAA